MAMIFGISVFLCGCGQSAEKQLELGQNYLLESDYEQAIVAFGKAIEIDPKQWDAYVGLAKAYQGIGDIDQAASIMEEGMAQVEGSEILEEDIDFLAGLYEEQIGAASEQGDLKTVLNVYEKVQEFRPEDEIPVGIPHVEVIFDPENGIYQVQEYDANGNMIKEAYYDMEGAFISRWLYEYDENGHLKKGTGHREDGAVYQVVEYDADGNWLSLMRYNEDGTLKEAFQYDSSGDVREYSEWEYDESGNAVKCNIYQGDENGILTLIQINEYNPDGSINEIQLDDSGQVEGLGNETDGDESRIAYNEDGSYIVYEYDENGDLAKDTAYTAAGEILYYQIYKFVEGRMSEATTYDADGNVTEYSTYEYDKEKNQEKWTDYLGNGQVWFYQIREFDENGMLRKVSEYDATGEFKRSWEYDADGNMIEAE